MKRWGSLTLACSLLAACGSQNPVAKGAENTADLPASNEVAPDPTAAAPTNATASVPGASPAEASATKIPAFFHGRWGMTPGDCTSTRGDNKGLVTIDGDEMRFYESVAIPGPDFVVGTGSIRGHFNFTGEGQTWTKFQSLRLEGQELIRTESNPTASYSYAKCD